MVVQASNVEPVDDMSNVPLEKGEEMESEMEVSTQRLVAASETVPPIVSFEKETRMTHDKWWLVLYILAYVTFIGAGSVLAPGLILGTSGLALTKKILTEFVWFRVTSA